MKVSTLVALIVLLTPVAGLADCPDVQDAPLVPDGSTASRDEMMTANKAILDYHAAVDAYLECLRKSGAPVARENRAIDKLENVAAKYNTAVRTYKKRSNG